MEARNLSKSRIVVAGSAPSTPATRRKTFLPFALPHITQAEIDEVVDTLRSGWLTTGPKTKRFEREFAERVGAPYALAVNSATAAMHLALDAIGLQPGDEVIVPVYTFTATAEVVVYFRARPVLVDVDPVTCNLDPSQLEKHITSRTRAIMVVHIAGLPAEMDAILAIARAYNLTVIAAALGLQQLARSEWLLERRRSIAQRYTNAFSQWPEVETPPNPTHVQHAWHLYMLRLRSELLTITRNAFIEELKQANIG